MAKHESENADGETCALEFNGQSGVQSIAFALWRREPKSCISMSPSSLEVTPAGTFSVNTIGRPHESLIWLLFRISEFEEDCNNHQRNI